MNELELLRDFVVNFQHAYRSGPEQLARLAKCADKLLAHWAEQELDNDFRKENQHADSNTESD